MLVSTILAIALAGPAQFGRGGPTGAQAIQPSHRASTAPHHHYEPRFQSGYGPVYVNPFWYQNMINPYGWGLYYPYAGLGYGFGYYPFVGPIIAPYMIGPRIGGYGGVVHPGARAHVGGHR
jgi:hypothetical protein